MSLKVYELPGSSARIPAKCRSGNLTICFGFARAEMPILGRPAGGLTLAGLRRSEVLGLRWLAVDLGPGTVRVEARRVALDGKRTATEEPKSAASWRTVPVETASGHRCAVALLRSLKASQATNQLAAGSGYEESGFVLVDALGHPIRPEAYSDRFTVLRREAQVPEARLHDVRHTIATMLHRAGQAPADCAALLGHTLAVHLSTYVTSNERGTQTAAAALGQTWHRHANSPRRQGREGIS